MSAANAARTAQQEGPRPLFLFVPFYTPRDPERAAELYRCLELNLASNQFERIFLLQDDDTRCAITDPRIVTLHQNTRPTYLDWVRRSRQFCGHGLSVLANSDIYFDASVAQLNTLFSANPRAFLALSRHDELDGQIVAHPNPHWSQDAWAFDPGAQLSPSTQAQIDIALGTPRCDNKIAYLFSVDGFTVFNPLHQVRAVHVHETGLRYYDKRGDTSIKGTMAMVHESPALDAPAALDIEIWSQNSTHYTTPRVNKSLEKWARERQDEDEMRRRVLGYDADWQYPAITEKHAFDQMRALMPADGPGDDGAVYIGFPWATLIDMLSHAQHRDTDLARLEAEIDALAARVAGYERVITVCQHIRLPKYISLFKRCGITDIYWSHCETGKTHPPDDPSLTLHPFPLYPVQQVSVAPDLSDTAPERKLLFSFVGAKSTPIYMTRSRDLILDCLHNHPEGFIVNRDTWHYNKIVYDKQILQRDVAQHTALIDTDASAQFRQVMTDSIFSLCPSGTGPNSIRLWEAAVNNSIPVVLSDRYQPPGPERLWDLATVSCAEDEEAIKALPERLAAIAADPQLLRRKRLALYLFAQDYGPDRFVQDILVQMQVPE